MLCATKGRGTFLQGGDIRDGVGKVEAVWCMAVKGQERVAEQSAINVSGLLSGGPAARLTAQALFSAFSSFITHSILWYN